QRVGSGRGLERTGQWREEPLRHTSHLRHVHAATGPQSGAYRRLNVRVETVERRGALSWRTAGHGGWDAGSLTRVELALQLLVRLIAVLCDGLEFGAGAVVGFGDLFL